MRNHRVVRARVSLHDVMQKSEECQKTHYSSLVVTRVACSPSKASSNIPGRVTYGSNIFFASRPIMGSGGIVFASFSVGCCSCQVRFVESIVTRDDPNSETRCRH
ncbi:hypothetical protein TNCT_281151 [Trichonephila clavata]|uniref:Uncharacterized protein n=1 Tax=Trichonephila clavata TaxID=2740835 RepID=A0A8X6K280_TRICU|nr:hypothetical protein TNCT_281151 [Trichonephila clavata]